MSSTLSRKGEGRWWIAGVRQVCEMSDDHRDTEILVPSQTLVLLILAPRAKPRAAPSSLEVIVNRLPNPASSPLTIRRLLLPVGAGVGSRRIAAAPPSSAMESSSRIRPSMPREAMLGFARATSLNLSSLGLVLPPTPALSPFFFRFVRGRGSAEPFGGGLEEVARIAGGAASLEECLRSFGSGSGDGGGLRDRTKADGRTRLLLDPGE